MNITDICRHEVIAIDCNASLRDAAALMRERHVGALVVTARAPGGERATGMLTDRDLAVEVLVRGLDAGSATAGQLASRDLVAVPGDASIGDAVAAMAKAGVRRLLVTGPHGELTGIVSADDVLDALAVQLGGLASALRNGLAREAVQRPPAAAARPHPVFLAYGTPGMQQSLTNEPRILSDVGAG